MTDVGEQAALSCESMPARTDAHTKGPGPNAPSQAAPCWPDGLVDGLPRRTKVDPHEAAPEFLGAVPIAFAREHLLLGLESADRAMPVLLGRPDAAGRLDVLARLLRRPVMPVPADEETVLKAINEAYGQHSVAVESVLESFDRETVLEELNELSGRQDLLDSSGRAPVIKLVNLVLFEAVKARASDVHVQPYEGNVVVRFRVDGVMYDAFDLPKALQEEIVSRIKIMGKMDIAEKRLPQDGRDTVQLGDRIIDLRIASLPTSFGERIVIRLLDKSARLYHLEEIGMTPGTLARFRRLIAREHGLILVSGPTGSGKSTTLYAALQEIDHTAKNVLTLEDPIEYQLPGVSQTQVNYKKGMTFARGLRNVLRQDPDVIMVGEIRDRETATMAIQSALTGHLVFSTLHTNDAASAVTRLLDLGIEPYLVSSSVIGVLAQRLVRRVCDDCAVERPLDLGELESLDALPNQPEPPVGRVGTGCERCRDVGYYGRTGLFEMLTVDDSVRLLIGQHADAAKIKGAAIRGGMKTLREAGLDTVLAGTTTVEEVVRVVAGSTGD